MAWRIGQSVIRGEIDNRKRGQVMGRIWLVGRAQPLVLKLAGNCLRDIAGSMVTFENPAPAPGEAVDLAGEQEGSVGDITASRRVRILDVPFDEAQKLWDAGKKPPEHMGNSLYLEWFSRTNGRVVLEGPDFIFTISEPEWTLTEAEGREQALANRRVIEDWMASVKLPRPGTAREDPNFRDTDRDWADEGPDERPMDEFAWEKSLKESDRITDKYSTLLDQYMDHPDRDRLIAREMGWSWLEDALDDERESVKERPSEDAELLNALEDVLDSGPEPDPSREGVDWIRMADGRVKHPLAHRAAEAGFRMRQVCGERGLLAGDRRTDVHEMVWGVQTLSAKLAGALNGLARQSQAESGFVVACLKRALKPLDSALGAVEKVRGRQTIEAAVLDEFRGEIFAIREEMLRLMQEHRGRIRRG